jgi:NADPH-dependent curcumin reductase CurA
MHDTKVYKKLVARQFSRNFREATEVVEASIPTPEANQIVVRNLYAGKNCGKVVIRY